MLIRQSPVIEDAGRATFSQRITGSFQISGKDIEFARTGPGIAARGYASPPDARPGKGWQSRLPSHRILLGDATEVQMHIGSVFLAVWLVVGGIAAGQRGDYKGPIGCSRASTIGVTIIAGPLNYAGVDPNINCTVQHPSN
jgi:hypothetical protein